MYAFFLKNTHNELSSFIYKLMIQYIGEEKTPDKISKFFAVKLDVIKSSSLFG